MKKRVSELKPGERFYWRHDLAYVHDICEMPEHFFSGDKGMMYSMDVGVPGKFRGVVRVLGSTEVEVPS